jgi:hypothetical protein
MNLDPNKSESKKISRSKAVSLAKHNRKRIEDYMRLEIERDSSAPAVWEKDPFDSKQGD